MVCMNHHLAATGVTAAREMGALATGPVMDQAMAVVTDALRKIIQERAIYVCAPGEVIPGRSGAEWRNVFRLRWITQDGRWLPLARDALSAMMLVDGIEPQHVQFAGLETGAIPLVTALAIWHGTTGFIVRKEAREDGARNLLEGPVTDRPVVLVDDVVASGARAWQCLDGIVYRASHLCVHKTLYALVKNGGPSELCRGEQCLPVRSVFQRQDFDYTWRPERTPMYQDMLR